MSDLIIFENFNIRRIYDDKQEKWFFSVVDIIQALTEQVDYQKARNYWNKLAERLRKEGSEVVTNCQRLKLEASDGKKYLTDVADTETILRLVQSVPSKKAEPIKMWFIIVLIVARKMLSHLTNSLPNYFQYIDQKHFLNLVILHMYTPL